MISPLRTALKIIAGFVLLAAGFVLSLPGVPGPGIVVILLGLWLLSDHFDSARKLLVWAEERLHRLKKKQAAPRGGAGEAGDRRRGETEII